MSAGRCDRSWTSPGSRSAQPTASSRSLARATTSTRAPSRITTEDGRQKRRSALQLLVNPRLDVGHHGLLADVVQRIVVVALIQLQGLVGRSRGVAITTARRIDDTRESPGDLMATR